MLRSQLGRPARGVVGIAARCVCGNPTVVATAPRLADGTPFPTFYYLTHPGATAAMSGLEAGQVMREFSDELAADPDLAAAYARAHEAYLRDRAGFGDVDEIDGISAGGMPTRVKCLHALAAHALAAGPGVNPIGDRALALSSWSPRALRVRRTRGGRMSRRALAAAAAVLAAVLLTGAAAAPAVPAPANRRSGAGGGVLAGRVRDRVRLDTTRGAGVRIAIIDTGVGRGPVEFEGAVVGGTDVSGVGSYDGRTPVGAVDANHGSWVASLAAARGNGPGTGMIGVAPEAELLAVSVGFGSSTKVPFSEQIAEAIRWSVDNGADVINLSLTTNSPDWDESWDYAFLYAFENDVVVVVAAGNRGAGTSRVGAPATIPGVLTVAGVDPEGRASLEASTQGITIGVSAPSEDLVGVSADGRLVLWNGTSGAAPIVAGIAALVRAAHPDLDAANVINRIIRTARPWPSATGARIRTSPICCTATVWWMPRLPYRQASRPYRRTRWGASRTGSACTEGRRRTPSRHPPPTPWRSRRCLRRTRRPGSPHRCCRPSRRCSTARSR